MLMAMLYAPTQWHESYTHLYVWWTFANEDEIGGLSAIVKSLMRLDFCRLTPRYLTGCVPSADEDLFLCSPNQS